MAILWMRIEWNIKSLKDSREIEMPVVIRLLRSGAYNKAIFDQIEETLVKTIYQQAVRSTPLHSASSPKCVIFGHELLPFHPRWQVW